MFLRQLVVPVAVWGTWFVHGSASTWRQLQQRLLGVLYDGGKSPASPDLIALLQGHSLDFQFMADYQTISMWAKLVQLGRALAAQRHERPFLGNASVVLREAWRFERFAAWKAWQLWNATCAQGCAVLTAAVVSPARRQANQSGAAVQWCPFCRLVLLSKHFGLWRRLGQEEETGAADASVSAPRAKKGKGAESSASPSSPDVEMMDAPDEQERVRELRELGGRAPTTPPMSTLLEKKSGGHWNKAPRPSDTRTEQTGLHRGHRPDLVLRLARLVRPGAEPSNHLRPSTGISFSGGVLEWLANYEASITRQSLIDVTTTGSQGGAPQRESSRADCPIHGGNSCDQVYAHHLAAQRGTSLARRRALATPAAVVRPGRLAHVATGNISAWTGLAAVVTAPVLLSVQRGSMEVVEETLAAIAHQSAGLTEGAGAEAARAVQVAGAAASIIVIFFCAQRCGDLVCYVRCLNRLAHALSGDAMPCQLLELIRKETRPFRSSASAAPRTASGSGCRTSRRRADAAPISRLGCAL
ncbi:unnamed protein product [Symbiodinium necroappetens]|uniref:Uncharacterized protein n=1 Tax=Symbiodinium necroappetens TaxID=1628268 RepID=A0A812X6C4_9DINO|nr:unnamed protein product [Symbiodinium necroappetens]